MLISYDSFAIEVVWALNMDRNPERAKLSTTTAPKVCLRINLFASITSITITEHTVIPAIKSAVVLGMLIK